MKTEVMRSAKAEKFLNQLCRFSIGVMTRKQRLNLFKQKGYTAGFNIIHDEPKERKEAEELKRIFSYMPWGNECHPLVKEYHARKAELDAGFFKNEYFIDEGKGYQLLITKTEYEYYVSL